MLKPTKAAISQSKKEYNSQLVLTTTDAGNSYFSEKSGGYLIAMKRKRENISQTLACRCILHPRELVMKSMPHILM